MRATGSRERAPDDRFSEAIHSAASGDMDCFAALAKTARVMVRSLHAPERDRAGERSGPRANRSSIIAAMNDPLAVGCLSGNDSDVMRPNDHHADSGAAGIHAFARPRARERKTTVRFAKIFAQIAAAPAVRPVTVMPVLGTRLCLDGKHNQECRRDKQRLQHGLLHKTLMVGRVQTPPQQRSPWIVPAWLPFLPLQRSGAASHGFAVDPCPLRPDISPSLAPTGTTACRSCRAGYRSGTSPRAERRV